MLSVIPVPIGNKEDITLRALRLLQEVQLFFCEDTRTARQLFRLYDIDARTKQFLALTSFTDQGRLQQYVQMMKEQHCGLVSEAGTPWLSDPGKEMIKLCREREVPFEVLPGANALIPAVVGTYADTSRFSFYGFLPAKKWRQTVLKAIMNSEYPVFAYESVHRMGKLAAELKLVWFKGTIHVFRELTKMFEQKRKWTAEELDTALEAGTIPTKGEFVVCFIPDAHG